MSIDWSKPIQTRDGRKAELLRKINQQVYPYIVLITNVGGYEFVLSFDESGRYEHAHACMHIINVPETQTSWRAVYRGGAIGAMRNTRTEALEHIGAGAIAVLRIDVTGDQVTATVEAP